uniref:ABC transporter substrate-binding protein n=1 Tax=Siccirubricoccus soli TaxID=2899147 RepID=A0ABT1DA27_9PROT|nr:ABC transporter substrate-binding protein [Siccirubricoccus soli]MCO6418794.1 ABC transporter substrate-binding protein [Siccirubricoccus soli]MCP2684929.1 ABC transporter substrate-binding protein [Siccirubricoccus soli]
MGLTMLAGGAAAQRPADEVVLGIAVPPSSVDPHVLNASPNSQLAAHVFSRLVERDARFQPRPGLAREWRQVGEDAWEFRLVPGVLWHDGRPFTAEDVAFSLARAKAVPNGPGGFGGLLRMVARVEVTEPLVLRITTRRPHAQLPLELSTLSIVSRHAGQGATTEDYNSGRAAIGTGPYRLLSHLPNERTELVRNEHYFGPREPWARVTLKVLPQEAARAAALRSGAADLIEQVPAADLAAFRRDTRFGVFVTPGLRLMFLQLDLGHPQAPQVTDGLGRPLAANPFRDRRVRLALSHAIDRAALAERVLGGAAVPAGQWLPPGTPSFDPGIAPPRHDPALARRLLAEAGYPEGFRLLLLGPQGRYLGDLAMAQAVAGMWDAVGVATEVVTLPWAGYTARSMHLDFAARLASWTSLTGEASNPLSHVLGTYDPVLRRGSANLGRYSNPALDSLVEQAMATEAAPAREAMLRQALRLAAEDVPVIPLVRPLAAWAARRGLRYEPRMDERTLAMGLRPE